MPKCLRDGCENTFRYKTVGKGVKRFCCDECRVKYHNDRRERKTASPLSVKMCLAQRLAKVRAEGLTVKEALSDIMLRSDEKRKCGMYSACFDIAVDWYMVCVPCYDCEPAHKLFYLTKQRREWRW